MPDTRRTQTPAPPGGGWTAGAAVDSPMRDDHVNELRTAIDTELQQRLGDTYSFTDPTITPDVTKVKASHINELRAACEDAEQLAGCATDTASVPTWEDEGGTAEGNRVEANVTQIRDNHVLELRTYMESLSSQCLCDCHSHCCDCDGHCSCNCNGHCNCEGHWEW